MVECTDTLVVPYFIIIHLGVSDTVISQKKFLKKKLLIKQIFNWLDQTPIKDYGELLLNAIYILESSGKVNAGAGCNLTSSLTAELDASFL